MTLQYSLDYDRKLPPSAQEGMERADENASKPWKYIFDACVVAAAKQLPEITSDDVLAEYQKLNYQPGTHSLCAIGPAMTRAAEMGAIKATEAMVRSKRPEKNGNLHRVWKSNLWRK